MSPLSFAGKGSAARGAASAGDPAKSRPDERRAQRQYLQRLVKYSTDPVLRSRAQAALEHIAV